MQVLLMLQITADTSIMLKWTSKSSFGSESSCANDATKDTRDSKSEAQNYPDSHAIGSESCSLTRGRPRSFDGASVNRSSNLPFSYTAPATNQRPGYPYLKRLDPQSSSNTGTSVIRATSINPTPSSPSLKSSKIAKDEFSRSKSVPRLGSPVSSASSLGGSKKGILYKVKKIFRRSKGDVKERRSVSQPSSPKAVSASRDIPRGKYKTTISIPDVKNNKLERAELSSTRLRRRIELKRPQRTKLMMATGESPFISSSEAERDVVSEGVVNVNRESRWSLSSDLEGDRCEDHFGQQQPQHQPTFETFKASTPRSSYTGMEETFKNATDLESIPRYQNWESTPLDQYKIEKPPGQNSDILQDCPAKAIINATSTSQGLSYPQSNGSHQPRTLQQTVSELQLQLREKIMTRPRTSYSRISNMKIYDWDSTIHQSKTAANEAHDRSPVMSVQKAHISQDHDSMNSLMQFAEDLAATLERRSDAGDSDHDLESGIGLDKLSSHTDINNRPDYVIRSEEIARSTFWEENEDNFKIEVKTAEKDANHQTGGPSQMPEVDLFAVSDSPDNVDWSVEDDGHINYSGRDRNVKHDLSPRYLAQLASNYVNASEQRAFEEKTYSCQLMEIDLLAKNMDVKEISRMFDAQMMCRGCVGQGEMQNAVNTEIVDHSIVNRESCEIESDPRNSPSSNSLPTKSSSEIPLKTQTFSDTAVATGHSQDVPIHHKEASAKNNNNGHSASLKKSIQFESEDCSLLSRGEDEKYVKDTDWPETRRALYTEYVVGMARHGHFKPKKQEHGTGGSSHSSPVRVKNIVHHLEERIKKKVDSHAGMRLSQELNPHSGRVPSKGSLSTPFANKDFVQHRNDVCIDKADDSLCLQVTDVVRENLAPRAIQASPVSDGDFSCRDVEVNSDNYCEEVSTNIGFFRSPDSDVVFNSSSGNAPSYSGPISSDTHSICSDPVQRPSSGASSNTDSLNCQCDSIQDQAKGNISQLSGEYEHDIDVLSVTHGAEGVFDERCKCHRTVSCTSESTLNPYVTRTFLEEKGITDVTPPHELVQVNSSPGEFESSPENRKRKNAEGGNVDIFRPQQYFQKQDHTTKDSSLRDSKVGASTRILKKPDSILSPAYKPPSPVKKTVSFKLDKTPTPSPSPSSISDDAAICETVPSRQKGERVEEESPVIKAPSEESLTDQTVSTDECLAVSCKSDSSPDRCAQMSSVSGDDLSWWGTDHEEGPEFSEKSTRDNEKPSPEKQGVTDTNAREMSGLTQTKDEEDSKNVILTKHVPANRETAKLHAVKQYTGLKKSPTIEKKATEKNEEDNKNVVLPNHVPANRETAKSHAVKRYTNLKTSPTLEKKATEKNARNILPQSDLNETEKSGQVRGQWENVIANPPSTHQKDNTSERSDTRPERSDSSSILHTYNITKRPLDTSMATHSKDTQDDDIDGLVVDIDVSSALSDLVDQVESSGPKSTPLQSPLGSEITSPILDKHKRSGVSDEVLENIPFWEKNRVSKTQSLKKIVFPHKNIKSRLTKQKSISLATKTGQLIPNAASNVTDGHAARPRKRKTFRYWLVKSPASTPKELHTESNDKSGSGEKSSTLGVKGKDINKEKSEQKIPDKSLLQSAKANFTRQLTPSTEMSKETNEKGVSSKSSAMLELKRNGNTKEKMDQSPGRVVLLTKRATSMGSEEPSKELTPREATLFGTEMKVHCKTEEIMGQIPNPVALKTTKANHVRQQTPTIETSPSPQLCTRDFNEIDKKKERRQLSPRGKSLFTQATAGSGSDSSKKVSPLSSTSSKVKQKRKVAGTKSIASGFSVKCIKKEASKKGKSYKSQSLEAGDFLNLEMNQTLAGSGKIHLACSAQTQEGCDDFKETKTFSLETRPSSSLENSKCFDLIQTDREFALEFSSDSSLDGKTYDGQNAVAPLHTARTYTESSDDSNGGFSESFDDLTYDVHGKDGIRHWQDQDRCGSRNFYNCTEQGTKIPLHQPVLCSCSYSLGQGRDSPQLVPLEHGKEDLPQEHALPLHSQQVPQSQTVSWKGPGTAPENSSGSTSDNRPGEWLFIATFFLFQVLLHWLHATSK